MSQLGTLGKYHILERLASDAVAEIYKVKTLGIAGFEKVQVLKRILPRFSRDPKFVRFFVDEAKIAFSLNHRNIVQVFEFGKVDGDLFLAMEYIPGVNLQQVILRARRLRKPMPVGLTCYLMGEVAAGLEYAHRKSDHFGKELGIVHTDVNPRNLACSFEGSVKILDFGISRAVWTAIGLDPSSNRDPHYCSPEQARGEPLTVRSDLFSFGVILWELLIGRHLFEGETPDVVLQNVQSGAISSPRALNPEVPPHLDEFTQRCLLRDPEKRIESASDLQLELHRIQRILGAVIGSRALSTYLEGLFPDHGDARDVRQDGSTEVHAEFPLERAPDRNSALVEAATELAQKPNPPAPVLDSSRSVSLRGRHQLLKQRAASGAPRREDSQPDSLAELFDRSHPAIDTSPPPLPLRKHTPPGRADAEGGAGRPRRELLPNSSGERTPAVAPLARAPGEGDHSVELSVPDLLELEEEDFAQPLGQAAEPHYGQAGPDEPTADAMQDDDGITDADAVSGSPAPRLASTPRLSPATGEYDPTADQQALAPGRTDPELPADLALEEKKRFIAVAVLLEGPASTLQGASALLADIAYKLDGIALESSPDRLMVVFGLPTADENDIVAAVRFALDAREAAAHLSADADPNHDSPDCAIAIRIGIRAGTARQGPPSQPFQLLGNTLSEAEALARHASASQILVAGAATPLAAVHHTLQENEPLPGHGQARRCYRVLGPSQRSQRRRATPATSFVGREVEIRAMRSGWREAVMRGGQRSVLIVGDAGIGKSRLLDEFLARNSTEAHLVAVAATPHRSSRPYTVIVDLLRGITGVWSARGPRSRQRLMHSLGQLLGPGHEHALETFSALVMPREDASVTQSELFEKKRVQLAVRALLNRISSTKPTIVMVDDLHWADSASLECLDSLVEQAGDATGPLLFLLSRRPNEDSSAEERVHGDSVSLMALDELDDRDRERLVVEELGDRATPPVIQEVLRRAGGNPFYICELTRAVTELRPSAPAEVPPTVRGVVAGRLDRLPGNVKLVLQYAAVIGPTFREGILAKVVGRNPARALAVLRNGGLIIPGLRTAAPIATASGVSEQFEREWAFRHVLIQEVVYEALGSATRRNLHRQVAEIMLKRLSRGSSDGPAEVARHLELGGETRAASEFYLRAGNEAAAAFASREALDLYASALRLGENDPAHQYLVHAGRERVYGQLGLHQQQAADLEALARLCGDDPARLADLRNRQAYRLLRLGELHRALELAQQAEAAATQNGDELSRGEALRLQGEAYDRLNDHRRATEAVSKALQVFQEQQAVPSQAQAQVALGRICLAQARYDDAVAHYGPALELIRQLGDQWQERMLLGSLAVVHYCRGDFSLALEEAQDSLRLCEKLGDRAREGDSATVMGFVCLEIGLYDFARRYLEDALAVHRETGSQWSEADTLVHLGLLETASRSFPAALRQLEAAVSIAERIGAKYISVNARNAIVWTLCERGGPSDAAQAAELAAKATGLAHESHMIVGEIPGLCRSARAAALLGDLEGARVLSQQAVDLLAQQRIIESSEEEIYYTHYRILSAQGDPDCRSFLSLAHDGFMSKLARLDQVEHRAAFEAVRLNAAIRRDHLEEAGSPALI